ncbi:MAG: hypothetical protein SynsKO_20690 [Synoicihabitans sp.]
MPFDNISICAIVPVRSGSKRVINKNIRPFAGTSLLEIKIRQLLDVNFIDQIYVSSDADEMLKIAVSKGCRALKRPEHLASDTVPMSEVYTHLAENVNEQIVVFTHVTNPLCPSSAYMRAIETYFERSGIHDSLTTVSDVKDFLYLDGKPLNFDPGNKPRSQDLPDIIKLNHAISVASRELMISERNIFGKFPIHMRLSQKEALDIDTELDFFIAESLFKRIELSGK